MKAQEARNLAEEYALFYKRDQPTISLKQIYEDIRVKSTNGAISTTYNVCQTNIYLIINTIVNDLRTNGYIVHWNKINDHSYDLVILW